VGLIERHRRAEQRAIPAAIHLAHLERVAIEDAVDRYGRRQDCPRLDHVADPVKPAVDPVDRLRTGHAKTVATGEVEPEADRVIEHPGRDGAEPSPDGHRCDRR